MAKKISKKEGRKHIFEFLFYLGLAFLFLSIFYFSWGAFAAAVILLLSSALYFERYHPKEEGKKKRFFHLLIFVAAVMILYFVIIMKRYIAKSFIRPENEWTLYAILLILLADLVYLMRNYIKKEERKIYLDLKRLKIGLENPLKKQKKKSKRKKH